MKFELLWFYLVSSCLHCVAHSGINAKKNVYMSDWITCPSSRRMFFIIIKKKLSSLLGCARESEGQQTFFVWYLMKGLLNWQTRSARPKLQTPFFVPWDTTSQFISTPMTNWEVFMMSKFALDRIFEHSQVVVGCFSFATTLKPVADAKLHSIFIISPLIHFRVCSCESWLFLWY